MQLFVPCQSKLLLLTHSTAGQVSPMHGQDFVDGQVPCPDVEDFVVVTKPGTGVEDSISILHAARRTSKTCRGKRATTPSNRVRVQDLIKALQWLYGEYPRASSVFRCSIQLYQVRYILIDRCIMYRGKSEGVDEKITAKSIPFEQGFDIIQSGRISS